MSDRKGEEVEFGTKRGTEEGVGSTSSWKVGALVKAFPTNNEFPHIIQLHEIKRSCRTWRRDTGKRPTTLFPEKPRVEEFEAALKPTAGVEVFVPKSD